MHGERRKQEKAQRHPSDDGGSGIFIFQEKICNIVKFGRY